MYRLRFCYHQCDRSGLYRNTQCLSPNGDNLNDIFRPVIIGPGTLLDFQVYNRWGEMVFEWTGEGPGWDGTLNGVNVELGTYIVTSHAQDDLPG